MGKPTSSRNAASAGPCGRISGQWRPQSAPRGARPDARVREPTRLPAGPLRHRPQHPPDRHRAGVADWQVQAALARLQVRLAPRPRRLAAQRRRHTEQRIAARVAALGFTDVQEYLVDRVVQQGWLLAEVAAELAAHRLTVRRLLDRHGIRRVRRTPRERAASESGRRVQAVGWQARRAARLAELGLRIWPATSRRAMSSRAGRSSACGPSLGLAAGGWWGSWPGWGCGSERRCPGVPRPLGQPCRAAGGAEIGRPVLRAADTEMAVSWCSGRRRGARGRSATARRRRSGSDERQPVLAEGLRGEVAGPVQQVDAEPLGAARHGHHDADGPPVARVNCGRGNRPRSSNTPSRSGSSLRWWVRMKRSCPGWRVTSSLL
jgi:hypothetical protein